MVLTFDQKNWVKIWNMMKNSYRYTSEYSLYRVYKWPLTFRHRPLRQSREEGRSSSPHWSLEMSDSSVLLVRDTSSPSMTQNWQIWHIAMVRNSSWIKWKKFYLFTFIIYLSIKSSNLFKYLASDITKYWSLQQEKKTYLNKALNLSFILCFIDVCDPSLLAKPCLHDGYQDPKNCSRCRCADGLGGDYCEDVQSHPHSAGNLTFPITNCKTLQLFIIVLLNPNPISN